MDAIASRRPIRKPEIVSSRAGISSNRHRRSLGWCRDVLEHSLNLLLCLTQIQ
jgi:hypothetical protein